LLPRLVAPPQESIAAASATVNPTRNRLARLRANSKRPLSLLRKTAKVSALNKSARARIGRTFSPSGTVGGEKSSGFLGALPAAGTLKICTVSRDVTVPFTGKEAELGLKVHATPAGAAQVRLNCPAKLLVPVTVTAKFVVPPTGIVAAVGVIEPIIAPEVICMF
jgi:hypothetical protein